MIETILVPVDGSPQSQAAIEYTRAVFPETNVILLTVIDPVDGFAGYSGDESGNWEERAKAEAKSLLRDAQTEFVTPKRVQVSVVVGNPVDTIAATADDMDVDQIVIGSHGRDGIQRLIVGSVAEQVMRQVPVPVTITR